MSEEHPISAGKRVRRGRPAKPDGAGRTLSLPPVRVSAAESALIEERASRAGLSVSAYLREAALDRDISPPRRTMDDQLLVELNRCGVNLHQLVRHLNFGGTVPTDIVLVMAELKAALAQVSAAYDA